MTSLLKANLYSGNSYFDDGHQRFLNIHPLTHGIPNVELKLAIVARNVLTQRPLYLNLPSPINGLCIIVNYIYIILLLGT